MTAVHPEVARTAEMSIARTAKRLMNFRMGMRECVNLEWMKKARDSNNPTTTRNLKEI